MIHEDSLWKSKVQYYIKISNIRSNQKPENINSQLSASDPEDKQSYFWNQKFERRLQKLGRYIS